MANATSASDLSSLPSLATYLHAQKWSASIAVLLVSLLALFIKSTWQPAWPKGAPKLIRHWPIVGAVQLFGQRRTFFRETSNRSPTGHFSIYVGKHQVVGLTGLEARKTFFETKALNMSKGYAVLFTGSPPSAQAKLGDVVEDFTSWMLRHMTKLLQRDNFVRNLPLLVSDTSAMLDDIVRRGHGGGDEPTTGIFDPFDDMYKIVYQMTMRTLGCNEVADDLPLLWKTLALFEEIEHGSGPTKIIFPWIPTVGSLRQTIAGARLYAIFSEVAKKRKAEGRRENDTFQYLMDTGVDMVYVLSFIVAGIFAGLLNSGINAAWLLAFLANNPEWYRRVQAEVDASVAKHRKSPSQTPSEVLATLTLDDWESEFPSIDLGLRESIRISMVGTAFRRNIGGGAVPIGGGTGEIIPRDAVALYMPDEVHMDPAVYANPAEFDPGRFLPGRAEDKAVPLAYLGWGAGRHPCLGVRFAKLEMGITTAMFAARFDWALVDGEGNPTRELPPVDRQKFAAHKPDEPIRLRYTERQY